ncbi:MAG: transcriptional regulator, TetR family [Verrucomicrobiaceae bacterium]|nr:transcriptional regulator, TetR family [Verrucomicrobiaceae bacterium]
MNAKPVAPDQANKREHILEAVTSIFLQHGFHGASMRDVCAAAEMSPGALYRYFPSKDHIIEAVVDLHHERWSESFRVAGQAGGFFDALDYLTACALEEGEVATLPLWMEIAAEAARNERIANVRRTHYESLSGIIASLAADAIANGELNTQTNAKDVAAVVISAFDGLKLRRGADRDFDFRRTLRCSVLMLGHALGGKATNNRIRPVPPSR